MQKISKSMRNIKTSDTYTNMNVCFSQNTHKIQEQEPQCIDGNLNRAWRRVAKEKMNCIDGNLNPNVLMGTWTERGEGLRKKKWTTKTNIHTKKFVELKNGRRAAYVAWRNKVGKCQKISKTMRHLIHTRTWMYVLGKIHTKFRNKNPNVLMGAWTERSVVGKEKKWTTITHIHTKECGSRKMARTWHIGKCRVSKLHHLALKMMSIFKKRQSLWGVSEFSATPKRQIMIRRPLSRNIDMMS